MAHKDGTKSGGRKKGSPFKKGVPNADEIAKRLGVDPFEVLLHFVKEDWKALGYESKTKRFFNKNGYEVEEPIITPEIRAMCAKEAAQYLYSKKRAIEVSGEIDHGVNKQSVMELVQSFSGMLQEMKEARRPIKIVSLEPKKEDQ